MSERGSRLQWVYLPIHSPLRRFTAANHIPYRLRSESSAS